MNEKYKSFGFADGRDKYSASPGHDDGFIYIFFFSVITVGRRQNEITDDHEARRFDIMIFIMFFFFYLFIHTKCVQKTKEKSRIFKFCGLAESDGWTFFFFYDVGSHVSEAR